MCIIPQRYRLELKKSEPSVSKVFSALWVCVYVSQGMKVCNLHRIVSVVPDLLVPFVSFGASPSLLSLLWLAVKSKPWYCADMFGPMFLKISYADKMSRTALSQNTQIYTGGYHGFSFYTCIVELLWHVCL